MTLPQINGEQTKRKWPQSYDAMWFDNACSLQPNQAAQPSDRSFRLVNK